MIVQTTALLFLTINNTGFSSSLGLTSGMHNGTFPTVTPRAALYSPYNNPWNLITLSTQDYWLRVINCLYIMFLAVGVPANIVNCVVFYRQGLGYRMNLCLYWLAAADLGYLVTLATNSTVTFFFKLVDPDLGHKYYLYNACYTTGVINAFLSTSFCTTVVIAVERCLCVLFPLKAQTLMSTRTTAIILFTLTLLLQMGFAIFPLRMTVSTVVNHQTGKTLWIMKPGSGQSRELLEALYSVVFDFILLFMLPITSVSLVVLCTAVTVVRLKRTLAWRVTKSTSSNSDVQIQQIALTKMLVVVCCIFVVCSTPSCIMALVRRIEPQYSLSGNYANTFTLSHSTGYQVFSATNSSVNFFVYYTRSSRFRQDLRRLCFGKKKCHD